MTSNTLSALAFKRKKALICKRMTGSKTLILGGVRSGKSRLAEKIAHQSQLPVIYIATATGEDDEMQQRIALHQAHRPKAWQLIEEPIQLASALQRYASSSHCLLVDCLTLWLTNLLMHNDEKQFSSERQSLLQLLPDLPGKILMVSNETNLGITPLGELSRRYCDEAGKLHQEIAQCCDQVVMTIAGLPMMLKGEPL